MKRGRGAAGAPRGYSAADHQCQYCHRMFAGPHEGFRFDQDVPGVSTGVCDRPECERLHAERFEQTLAERYGPDWRERVHLPEGGV